MRGQAWVVTLAGPEQAFGAPGSTPRRLPPTPSPSHPEPLPSSQGSAEAVATRLACVETCQGDNEGIQAVIYLFRNKETS